jgi:hypothetical protein
MNIDEARQKLLDLVYGELDEPSAAELLRMMDADESLRRELADLLAARAGLARMRANEPASIRVAEAGREAQFAPAGAASAIVSSARAARPAGVARSSRRALRIVGWLSPLAAAACVLVILLPAALHSPRAPVAEAATGPADIRRTEVSLTILSEPPPRPGRYYAAGAGRAVLNSASGWGGLALVRDRRLIRNLPRGQSEVRVTEVPAGIMPDTVRLRSLDDPEGLAVLEQNYEYDLAGAEAILKRYIDKPIGVVDAEGRLARNSLRLLSYSPADLVVMDSGPPSAPLAQPRPVTVSREKLKAIRFADLPGGLLTRPTLVWTLNNRSASRQQCEVAYMTRGLSWRADYVLRLAPGQRLDDTAARSQAASQERDIAPLDAAGNPQILDSAELTGFATVTNLSGTTYANAQLKLLAGDVHLIYEDTYLNDLMVHFLRDGSGGGGKARGFEEKSLFEYHLYTLQRPTTLRDAETKQIELVTAGGIRLKRGYVYDRTENPSAARVVSEFKNSRASGLGSPLPKGVVRLYAPDPEGVSTYVAQTQIDHTPRDEKIRLPWGYAFDIACSATQTDNTRHGAAGEQKWLYSIRNHKDCDVTVTVIVRVPPSTTRADCRLAAEKRGRADGAGAAHPWRVREVGVVEIDVPVKAGQAANVDFSFEYDTLTGGGLRSPWEE